MKKKIVICFNKVTTTLFMFACMLVVFLTTAVSAGTMPQPYVCKVTIFSFAGTDSFIGINYTGHSFLMIENLTNNSLEVGHYVLYSYSKMTVGLWGNQSAHSGVWYNIEAHESSNPIYSGRVSISEKLVAAQLYVLSGYIENHDYYNLLTFNCSSFACGAWNDFSTTTLSAGTPNLPYNLKNSIMTHTYATDATIYYNADVCYYNGSNLVYV